MWSTQRDKQLAHSIVEQLKKKAVAYPEHVERYDLLIRALRWYCWL